MLLTLLSQVSKNGWWSPLIQKCVKQKLLKMVDLLRKMVPATIILENLSCRFSKKNNLDFEFLISFMVLPLLCNHANHGHEKVSSSCCSTLWIYSHRVWLVFLSRIWGYRCRRSLLLSAGCTAGQSALAAPRWSKQYSCTVNLF